MSYGIFIDTTRCIACKACQSACKKWNSLPAEATENSGSFQNPPDFSSITYKLVRMQEQIIDGTVRWLFFPDQCRHCIAAPCLHWAGNAEAIFQDKKTGAVLYTEETKNLNAEQIIAVCPYDVPRSNAEGLLAKCDLCNDRIKKGMKPACVTTCPTGCLNFGRLDAMREMALKRLELVRQDYPDAQLIDPEEVRVIFLTAFAPHNYHAKAASFDPAAWKAQNNSVK